MGNCLKSTRQRVNRLILACSFAIVTLACFSQGRELGGCVTDEEGVPLYGANVSLINVPDSLLLFSVTADADGRFTFNLDASDLASKIIFVSMPGYYNNEVRAQEGDSNNIVLKRNSTELNEVVVLGRTGELKSKAGKFIYTPGEIAGSMPSAFDALELTPLLKKTSDDSFSILTKQGNAKIYINGKEPKESVMEIMAMLRSIPPKNIKRIEIVTSPGAMVDGGFNGGIIDIYVTLPDEGLLGQFRQNLSSYFTTFPTSLDEIYLGYQKSRVHSSLILRYTQSSDRNKSEDEYNYLNTGTNVKNLYKNTGHFNGIMANANMYVDLTPKSILGISVQTYTVERYGRSRITTETTAQGTKTTTNSQIRDVVPFKRPEAYVSAYYTLDLDDKGSYLDIRGVYSKVMTHNFRELDFPGSYERENIHQRFRNASGYFRLKKNFGQNGVLMAGAGYTNFNPADRIGYSMQNTYSEFSFYQDAIHAYAKYSRDLGKCWSAQIGLRWEYNHYNMRNRPSGEQHKMHYGDFLPSVNLVWNHPNGQHSISLDYWRMITSPGLDQLNPELKLSSDNTGYMGNPDLKSYTTDVINFSYTLFNHFFISSNFQTSKNYYTALLIKDNMTIRTPMIGGRYHHVNIIPGYFNDFFGFWNFNVAVQADYTHVKADDPNIRVASWSFIGQNRNTFRLRKDGKYNIQLTYAYSSKTKGSATETDGGHYLSLGFNAVFGKARLSASVNNILNTRPETRYVYPNYTAYSRNITNAVGLSLQFTYLFGNTRVRAAQNRIDE